MIVVLDGTLAVDRAQAWGGKARLAEAHAGDMLGEMSLLDAGARFSACVTLTPCALAVVDAQRLDEMITKDPRLGVALLASLSRRLSLRLRQVSARLSALLSQN
jgi:CRP-like cAMP-binding protein